jgi:general secretion pathway protein E
MIGNLTQLLALPHGMLLVTGPTGSGKTTTLYTALQVLHSPERQLVTVEDPVEYQLDGITQIQVKPEIGLTFAHALRSVLRHDPDVILVGEMRDLETARIAVQSALTGHLVLATLHTNHAGATVTRLLDMGIEPFLVTSTVRAVLAQRLIRRLCRACRAPSEHSGMQMTALARLGLADKTQATTRFYRPAGCAACQGAGYLGRRAVAELMVLNDALRGQVLARADGARLEALAVSLGMTTLAQDAFAQACAGQVSLDDVLRLAEDTEA